MQSDAVGDMNAYKTFLASVCAAALLSACTQYYGSVEAASIRETLASPRMAVTPTTPGWLLKDSEIHPLGAEQLKAVKEILSAAEVRNVPEKYYRDPADGNRGDESGLLFYLYASNAQCLGGRMVEGRVMMDDFTMSDEAAMRLTEVLRPQLQQLFGDRMPQ